MCRYFRRFQTCVYHHDILRPCNDNAVLSAPCPAEFLSIVNVNSSCLVCMVIPAVSRPKLKPEFHIRTFPILPKVGAVQALSFRILEAGKSGSIVLHGCF
jgi:hypothetical protein